MPNAVRDVNISGVETGAGFFFFGNVFGGDEQSESTKSMNCPRSEEHRGNRGRGADRP